MASSPTPFLIASAINPAFAPLGLPLAQAAETRRTARRARAAAESQATRQQQQLTEFQEATAARESATTEAETRL